MNFIWHMKPSKEIQNSLKVMKWIDLSDIVIGDSGMWVQLWNEN